MKGKFITFEGIDGSGKTTTIKMLEDYFSKEKIEYISTKEPGSFVSETNKKIRELIVSHKTDITPMTEAILFSADRRLHLEKLIWPSLDEGKIVLCDRYLDSTLAYQGVGRKLGFKNMVDLQEIVTNKTYPDITFYFDISIDNSQERISKRGNKNRLDNENREFFENVKNGYEECAKKFKKRFFIIDANDSVDNIFEKIKEKIQSII